MPVNHAAFARLVASQLAQFYAIEREDKENLVIQWFDPDRRVWVRGGGARRLHEVATDILYGLFERDLDEGAASIFGNKNFISPVVDLVKSYLPRAQELPPLDGDRARGLLRFSCGRVLDFVSGEVRQCTAEDRISLGTGYPYQEWDAGMETKAFVASLCSDLNALWEQGRDADELAPDRLERALQHSPLYRLFYSIFEDHPTAFWLLRQSVRAVAGLAGYEEVLFLVDPRGSNGKGTLLALMMAILGTGGGYYGTLDYEKHFIGSGMAQKCINNPDIAAFAGVRFVAINESPDSTASEQPLNTTLIKKLAGGDDPIVAMAKYKDPTAFRPQCLLMFCTNNEPPFPAKDGGFRSRVGYVNMPFEWVREPSAPGQRKIDVSVKERVVKTLPPEFMFWAGHLIPGLVRPQARVITPRPGKVEEDVAVQFGAAAAHSHSIQSLLSPADVGRRFADERLRAWDSGTAPSSRQEIKEEFVRWCARNGCGRVNPDAAFRDVLEGGDSKARVKFEGRCIHVFKRQSLGGLQGGDKVDVVSLCPAPQ